MAKIFTRPAQFIARAKNAEHFSAYARVAAAGTKARADMNREPFHAIVRMGSRHQEIAVRAPGTAAIIVAHPTGPACEKVGIGHQRIAHFAIAICRAPHPDLTAHIRAFGRVEGAADNGQRSLDARAIDQRRITIQDHDVSGDHASQARTAAEHRQIAPHRISGRQGEVAAHTPGCGRVPYRRDLECHLSRHSAQSPCAFRVRAAIPLGPRRRQWHRAQRRTKCREHQSCLTASGHGCLHPFLLLRFTAHKGTSHTVAESERPVVGVSRHESPRRGVRSTTARPRPAVIDIGQPVCRPDPPIRLRHLERADGLKVRCGGSVIRRPMPVPIGASVGTSSAGPFAGIVPLPPRCHRSAPARPR